MVGIAYYLMILQNQQKTLQLSATYNLLDLGRDETKYYTWISLMRLEWKDADDFWDKYNTVEWQAKWNPMFQSYDAIGLLWKKGLLSLDDIDKFSGAGCWILWTKYKPVIEKWREVNYSDNYIYWEQLCDALEPRVKNKFGTNVQSEAYFPKTQT